MGGNTVHYDNSMYSSDGELGEHYTWHTKIKSATFSDKNELTFLVI